MSGRSLGPPTLPSVVERVDEESYAEAPHDHPLPQAPVNRRGLIPSVRLDRVRVPTWDHYPYNLPAIHDLHSLELHPAVTYFVGENGSGKSTLLEAIAVALGFNPESGPRNIRFETRASHSELHSVLVPEIRGSAPDGYFLRAESFFNVASEIDRLDETQGGEYSHLLTNRWINAYGGVSLHQQSHGEGFLSLFQHRFYKPGIYLLDEPEAALSVVRQMTLLSLIHDQVRGGAQFIIATHSPIVLAYPDARIYRFDDSGMNPVSYEETESYQVMRDFVNGRERMLHHLIGDRGDLDSG